MRQQLYGLTARTADQLRAVLADGGATGGRQSAGAEARGVTWVLVAGEPDADGWHPGFVTVTSGPGWADETTGVLVAAADAGELVEGRRYLCTQTGSAADGTARFRAHQGGATAHAQAGWTSYPLEDLDWSPSGTLEVPGAGVYLVWASVDLWAQLQTGADEAIQHYVKARLYDVTNAAVIPGTEKVLLRHNSQLGYIGAVGGETALFLLHRVDVSGFLMSVLEVEAAAEFRVELYSNSVYTTPPPSNEKRVLSADIGYVRLAGGAGGGSVGGVTGTFGG